jgi:hypothetical protein
MNRFSRIAAAMIEADNLERELEQRPCVISRGAGMVESMQSEARAIARQMAEEAEAESGAA